MPALFMFRLYDFVDLFTGNDGLSAGLGNWFHFSRFCNQLPLFQSLS